MAKAFYVKAIEGSQIHTFIMYRDPYNNLMQLVLTQQE
jgi:hypothetical protein